MRAAYISEYGPEARFEIREVERPAPKPGEVLVKVQVSGIIVSDLLDIRGQRGPGLRRAYVPGWEVAGTVQALGAEVSGFELGQRVAGTFSHGGYAEYAAVPARTLRAIPERASFEQALVYLVNLPVAYLHFHTFGEVQPGQTVLVHGAAGGVGSLMTQLAKRNGNTVIALASSDEKLAFCRRVGADHAINYRTTTMSTRCNS